MAQPPVRGSPTPLLPALLGGPLLPKEPSTSAAAYDPPTRHKQWVLRGRQEFANIRHALSHCPTLADRNPETRQAQSREHPQISPPASDASVPGPLATVSFPGPRAIKSIHASPIPTASPAMSPPWSCIHPELGLPLHHQPASRLATSTSSRRPFFQPRQEGIPGRNRSPRPRPHPVRQPASAHKIQPRHNASKGMCAAMSNRYIPKSPSARRDAPSR